MLIINYGWFDIKSILVELINLEMAERDGEEDKYCMHFLSAPLFT